MIFNEIPATRVPGQYVEFAPLAPTGLSTLDYRVLIIGQGTSAGSGTAKELYTLSNSDQAASIFGEGSMIHRMARRYFQNNKVNQVKAIAATMDATGSATGKAVGSVQITHAATGDGSLVLYVGGERIPVPVISGMAVGDIATAIKNLIQADYGHLAVVATSLTDTVTFTAKNVGVTGNDIDIRVNYYDGEVLPAGVTLSITAMSSGSGDPDIASGSPSVIEQLGDNWFQLIAFPYTDSTNWTAIDTELERRFGATVQIDGVAFAVKNGSQSSLVSFGSGKNSKQISLMGQYDCPTPPSEVAAAITGQIAAALGAGGGSESRPFQTLPLVGVKAPKPTSRFTFAEQDVLLENGISTTYIDAGGTVRIQRQITTYQTNESEADDTAWLDVNTRFTALFIRWDWVNYLKTKYPRAKLASDTKRVGPGQVIMSPAIGRAEAVARFTIWEQNALVENIDYFKQHLIAARDESDPNAMNWFLPCDFVNQFMIGKTQIGVML